MSQASAPRILAGSIDRLPAAARVAVAVARWNEPVTRRLLAGALHGLAAAGRYAGVICLGAIIKGETSHDHHIAAAAAAGIERVARHRGVPVIFGVLTCDTLAQAMARAGGDAADSFAGNKGAESAATVVEMMAVVAAIAAGGGAS